MTDDRQPEETNTIEDLRATREKILRRIEDAELELAGVDELIASISDPVEKGRVGSLVKERLREVPGQTFDELLAYVEEHGGVPVGRTLRKRLQTSLTRSVREKTIALRGDKYFLAT